MSNEAFWKWFSAESTGLRTLEPELLAERLTEELRTHVTDLGVEVAEDEGGEPLEVVFTADGDPSRFDAVKSLVAAAPALDGWTFVALKPAMGFDFTLEAEGVELEGATLRFEPLEGAAGTGLRLYLPDAIAKEDDAESFIRLLLQTGIGEEQAAGIAHVEAAPLSAPGAQQAMGLPELPAYLERQTKPQA